MLVANFHHHYCMITPMMLNALSIRWNITIEMLNYQKRFSTVWDLTITDPIYTFIHVARLEEAINNRK